MNRVSTRNDLYFCTEMEAVTRIAALMLAGGLGTLARYGLTVFVQTWLAGRGARSGLAGVLGTAFPLGTLLINVVGSLILAFIVTLLINRALAPEWHFIIGTGFLGAFTTWSTFSLEAEAMLARGDWKSAGFYILGSFLLSLMAVVLGRILALRVLAAT